MVELRKGIDFAEMKIPNDGQVYRLESYRTLNPWWARIWRPKYNQKMLAVVHFPKGGGAIYDITEIANKMLGVKR